MPSPSVSISTGAQITLNSPNVMLYADIIPPGAMVSVPTWMLLLSFTSYQPEATRSLTLLGLTNVLPK